MAGERVVVLDAVELETPWGCLAGCLIEDPELVDPNREVTLQHFIDWAAGLGLIASSGYLSGKATG